MSAAEVAPLAWPFYVAIGAVLGVIGPYLVWQAYCWRKEDEADEALGRSMRWEE